MRFKTGDKIINFTLPEIRGEQFELSSLKGKRYMLSFFRFASCPFCNMRMHELVTRQNELNSDFTIVAVFDSSLENLQKYTTKHHALFSVLADEQNIAYKAYNIERSIAGIFKGIIFRMPTLMTAMLKGYIPWRIKGNMATMPADFLIDENGVIQKAYYGSDEGDHLAFNEIKNFSNPMIR
jgi:thioredoxin-dependent peroxiredoxin